MKPFSTSKNISKTICTIGAAAFLMCAIGIASVAHAATVGTGLTCTAIPQVSTSTQQLLAQIKATQQQTVDIAEKLQVIAGVSGVSATTDSSNTERVADSTTGPTLLTLSRDLTLWDRGADVALLQSLLATDRSIYPEGYVTGIYGTFTTRAVTRLENRYNLVPDGKIHDASLVLINAILAQGGASTSVPAGLLTRPEVEAISISVDSESGTAYCVVNHRPRTQSSTTTTVIASTTQSKH